MPESIARNLLIHYLLVLLVPVTMVILPPASGLWWLLKGLGAFIGMTTIGNFLSRPDFHRNLIGGAYGGFLFLLVVYGCALVFRDSSFGVVLWAVSVIMLFSLYHQILEKVKEKHASNPPNATPPDSPISETQAHYGPVENIKGKTDGGHPAGGGWRPPPLPCKVYEVIETRPSRIVMAKIKMFCPHCGQSLQCDESQQGKQVRCPPCGQLFLVPQNKV